MATAPLMTKVANTCRARSRECCALPPTVSEWVAFHGAPFPASRLREHVRVIESDGELPGARRRACRDDEIGKASLFMSPARP
jgi:hypothetical protein